MKARWLILVAMTFPFACSPPVAPSSVHPARADANLPTPGAAVDEITLERFGHRPAAPSYRVVLSKDGSVTYTGAFNVAIAKVGTFKANISREDFRRLEGLVKHSRFFEMESSYPFAFDVDQVKMSVSRAGRTKTIEDGWGSDAPIDLWALEMAIDGLVEKINTWKQVL